MGWGGVPTAGAGLVDGGVEQGPWFQAGLGEAGRGKESGKGWLGGASSGGSKGFGYGGVSGRGPRTCVVFLLFLTRQGWCGVGRGYPPTGGRSLVSGRVWGVAGWFSTAGVKGLG